MSNLNDTICALSTPSGVGAVGIVRLSGEKSCEIADKLFTANCKRAFCDFESYKLYLGRVNADGVSDQALAVYFRAPKSFTGEDVVEFQCHGGNVVLHAIIRASISLGARLATNGEFSRRAFFNGKLNLSSVEGMADLINAESEASAKLAYSLFSNALFDRVTALQSELEDVIAYVEAAFDYPEEDVPPLDVKETREVSERIIGELDCLLSTYKTGHSIKDGVSVCILGETNVGKSSLLNALIREDRSIVTDIAGTTRDVVSADYVYQGVKFRFFDTAGLRDTSDKIESIGIAKAKSLIQGADLVLYVIDSQKGFDREDELNLELLDKSNTVLVLNKTDIAADKQSKIFSQGFESISVSAKTGSNLDALKDLFLKKVGAKSLINTESVILTNERHASALISARDALKTALDILPTMPADCIILELRRAWTAMGEITGATASEKIIDTIFSKLCLGK